MKLRPAPRGPEMVNALSDQNVRDIVTMLLQILNQESFRNFANFLVKFTTRTQVNFTEALEDLRISFQSYPDAQGLYLTPESVNAFIDRLKALYQQNERMVGFLRGAIVERLTSELISQRCYAGECQSKQKYYFHVCFASFVADKLVKRRLEYFNAPSYIMAYGLNSITKLRNTPHYIEPDDILEQ